MANDRVEPEAPQPSEGTDDTIVRVMQDAILNRPPAPPDEPLQLSEDMLVEDNNRKEPIVTMPPNDDRPQPLSNRYVDDHQKPMVLDPIPMSAPNTAGPPGVPPLILPPGMEVTKPMPMGGQHSPQYNGNHPLGELRKLGWSLAQHNETTVDGKLSIMFMFVHNARGIFVQSYGANEVEALNSAYINARQSMDQALATEAEANKVPGLNKQIAEALNESNTLRAKLSEIQAKLSSVASLFTGLSNS